MSYSNILYSPFTLIDLTSFISFSLDKMVQNQQQIKAVATALRTMGDSLHNRQKKKNQWGMSGVSSSKTKQAFGVKSYTTQLKSYRKHWN